VAQLCPAPSSSREAPPDVAIQDAKVVPKGGKKRRKRRRQETTSDDDSSVNKQVGGSSAEHAMEATGCSKRQAQPPMDHFDKLLEEAYPNHAYPVKHKLWDCSLMKSFMTSGSLSQGMEANEVPADDDTVPFPGEDAVMMIYDRRPSPERRCVPDPSLGSPARYGQGCGNTGM
jgi:hypothetical protein